MFAGHFAVAAAAKSRAPKVPLWALVLSSQLLDVVFVPLLLLGTETIEPIGAGGYGQNIIHAPFTHSLVGAVALSLAAGLLSWRVWGRRTGLLMGGVAFSHWVLDFVVHRADMVLVPGASGTPVFGLGLWSTPAASVMLEAVLVVIGALMYYRGVVKGARGSGRTWGVASGVTMAVVLILALVTDVLGVS